MSKRILSILLTLTILIGVIAVIPISVSAQETEIADTGADVEVAESGAISQSDFNSRINSLRNDYPNGSYWGSSFDGGIECFGFARLVAYNVFYSHVYDWETSYSMDGVKAGDVVQYGNTTGNGHTIFVLSVSGSTIKYVDCNGNGGYCIVRWDDSVTIGTKIFGLYSFSYRHVSPGVNPDPNPIGHVMSESEGAGKTIPDGDYWICSKIAEDYFLDIPGNDFNTYNEQNVQTWRWDSGLPPVYDVFHITYLNNNFYKITQINTRMAIDVYGAYLESGSNVSMWEDTGSIAQQWSIEKSDGGYKIRSRCNNFYMDIYDGKHKNGTNILTWVRNNGNNQFFSFIPYAPNEKPVPNGIYKIGSAYGNSCYLDVFGIPRDFANKSNIVIYDHPDDMFQIEYAGNGYYRVSEATSQLSMEVNDDGTESFLTNSRNVNLFSKNNGKNQLWKIRKNNDNTFFFINQLSGYYLDLEGPSSDNGTNISQYQYNGNSNQRWKLYRVISADMVTVNDVVLNNDTESVSPDVSVKADNNSLLINEDYTVKITPDIVNGKGTVTITGINNYIDSVTKEFAISIVKPTKPSLEIILGDTDGDGDVSSIDATYILRYTAQIDVSIEEEQLMHGDVDGNEELEVVDATYIQRYLAEFLIPYLIGKPI